MPVPGVDRGTLFVSTELAARIERAEVRLSASMGHGVIASHTRKDAFVDDLGDGVAVYIAPASPMNKMIGVGFGPAIPDEQLARVEQKFRDRGVPLQAEVSTLADPAFAGRLSARGYVLQGFENVLGRPIESSDTGPSRAGEIEVGPMPENDGERWLDVAVTGFLHPDTQGVPGEPLPPRDVLEPALRDFLGVPGFRRYYAWVGGSIAGIATMRIDDGLAQLCGAATCVEYRRRGVQTALLQQRLADARHAGCDLALLTTQPGSKSQQNGHRQGFALLYSRAILVKQP